MASGIYRLTFLTGDTYIGKSVDLEQRWRQHTLKLEKGTAAAPMQRAFANSGYQWPVTEVLVYCHPDLLDEYEGMYINLCGPELNTSIPPRREQWEYDQLLKYTKTSDAMVQGVPALISTAFALSDEVEELKESKIVAFEDLEEEYCDTIKAAKSNEGEALRALGKIKSKWNDEMFREIGKEEAYDEIQRDARFRVERAQSESRSYKEQIEKMERASWWERLWKTW